MSGDPANPTFAQDGCLTISFLTRKLIFWLALVALITAVAGCTPSVENRQQPATLTISPELPTPLSDKGEPYGAPTSTFTNTIPVNEEHIPTNEWAVQLAPGVNPNILAAEYDAINLGPIGNLPRVYLFRRPSRDPYNTDSDPLAEDPRVEWIEQQYERKRSTRP